MPEISESQASKYMTHNEALRIADVLIQPVAISDVVSTPPGSPSDGDMYIVGPTATGAWTGHEDDLAFCWVTTWLFIAPLEGFHVWLLSEDAYFMYSGSLGWVPGLEGLFYDVGGSVNGVPTGSQVLIRAPMVRDVAFPDDFAGSVAVAGIAATAQADFPIKKNGSQVGYFRFAASGTTATFSTSGGATALTSGDVLVVEAPGTPDGTLADIGFTLKGTKS